MRISPLRRLLLTAAIVVLYVAHQDMWFWRTAEPFVWGVLPVGLAYHAAYALAIAVLMAILVKFAWPSRDHDA